MVNVTGHEGAPFVRPERETGLLRKRLSPLTIVVLIAIVLLIVGGSYYLMVHRSGPESGAPPIANDPYAGQITGPPAKSGPEAGVAP